MEHLEDLRKARNLRQIDIAKELGVDRTTYVKYETGASEPSFEILKKLSVYFDVSTDYLLFGSERATSAGKEGVRPSPEEKEILKIYRKLNDEGKKFVMLFLRTAENDERLKQEPNMKMA